MKMMKKVLSLFTALVMVFGPSLTVFADGGNGGTGGATSATTGTIEITNATKGQTYTAYKIFNATLNSNKTDIAYTATDKQKNFYVENGEDNPFDFTKNSNNTYYVTLKTGKFDTDVISFFQSFVDENTNVLNENFKKVIDFQATITADSNKVTFNDLPYGYYFLTSSLGSVVTIDSTNPNAEVKDKNPQIPTTDADMKKIVLVNGDLVDETTASIGDVIQYQVTVHAVNHNIQKDENGNITTTLITNYVIKDTPTNLKIDETKVTVKLKYGEEGQDQTLTIGTHFTVAKDTSGKLTVTIFWASDTNKDGVGDTSLYSAPADIVISYPAEVINTAANSGQATNNVVAFYNDSVTIGNDTTTVSTYSFNLTKTDGDAKPETGLNTNVLAGAVFKLYSQETGGNPVQFVDEGNGIYHVADSTETTKTSQITTPASGKVQVKGLGNGTYYLEETKAPDGYNMLTNRVPVTINDSNIEDTDENETVTKYGIEVENNRGNKLPETGGIGTTIFYILGSVLTAGAAVLMITRKRMNS